MNKLIVSLFNCSIAKLIKSFSHETMKQWNNSLRQKGFTLVELLVVIGIITLLMVTIFPNFTGARQRARDSQRKTDLKNVQTALDLYKLDQKPPLYPSTGALGSSLCGKCWSSDADCGASGGNVYIKKLPCDNSGTSPTPYAYAPNLTDNLRYTLSACLENPVDPDKDTGTPLGGCAVSYTVSEP